MRSIVDGDTVTFPRRGVRVVVKSLCHLVSLAGYQMKASMSEGADGVLKDIYGELDPVTSSNVVVLVVTKDDGADVRLVRDMDLRSLGSIYVHDS